jgi:HPr kinase/phosphorylase
MLDVRGVGVMLRGSSGVGKSECALALIERGHSLVADDLTVIKLLDERELMASSRMLNRGWMECRGIGIINIAEMFGIKSVRLEKRIDLVISLQEWRPDVAEERTGLEENYYEILGLKVPHIELFVRPGRDMARLVEVAALTQALKKMGHDPAKDFNDRLIQFMAARANQVRTIKPVNNVERMPEA